MNRLVESLFTLLLAGTGACAVRVSAVPTEAKPPWDSSAVQTDSLIYHLRRRADEYRAYATATLRNTTTSPIYFAQCNINTVSPMFGIRRTGADSTRRYFQEWDWACTGGVPTGTLNPGDSIVVRVPLGSVDQPTMQPALQPGDIVGELRIELTLCAQFETESGRCALLPQAQRSSNAFSVRY